MGDGSGQSDVVHLDDELEDVFSSTEKDKFSISQLSEQSDDAGSRRSSVTLDDTHRRRSFPHVLSHIRSRSGNPKRSGSVSGASGQPKSKLEYSGSTIEEQPDQESPADQPVAGSSAASESRASGGSVLDDLSDVTGKIAFTLTTDDEEPPSKSEMQPSALDSPVEDGCGFVDKRVQFDPQKLDANKKRRKSRHHHSHHHKARKYSLQEEPQWKREGRRVSIQPEDAVLAEADLEDLDSHRSDDPRGLRRPKIQKPQSGDAFIQISRKGGSDLNNLLTPTALKKMYDHSPHEVFVQLDELVGTGEDREWKETARWVKYEEDLEEGSDRWGRPHVASLSFHSLLNLRRCLQSCAFLLDTNEKDLTGVVYRVTEQMFIDELIAEDDKSNVMRSLLMRHKHVNDNDKSFRISFRKHSSYSSLQSISDMEKGKVRLESFDATAQVDDRSSKLDTNEKTYLSTLQDELKKEKEDSILKRIPAGAEATTVLVGSVDFLSQPTIAFVRLAQGIFMPSITEVTIPVRFMFVLLGPSTADLDYHEVGRSISTLMSNRAFHQIAYKATTRKDLLSAINDFLDDSIVLPPGNWESQAILPFEELKAKSDMIARRKRNAIYKSKMSIDAGVLSEDSKTLLTDADYTPKLPPFDPLKRTGRPFGGIWNDIKRRYPMYISDITDGLNGQCIAATIFMYFAALSSAITFGGLIADKTGNLIGISETLLSTAITGIVFALLAGQPMMVVGTTGPLLLLDQSLFNFCKTNDIDFLTMRIYIGIWLAIISTVVSSLEGSVLVKLFSRFLEDIFSSLISLIFIMEPITKLWTVFQIHPLLAEYCTADESSMALRAVSGSFEGENVTDSQYNETDYNCSNGMFCDEPESLTMQAISNQPNTALFSMLLTLGTFVIAYFLRIFRNGKFLGRSARRALGDFGVPIAIVLMVLLSYFNQGIYTEKLNVPLGLTPSDPTVRGWFIPFGGSGEEPFPIWMMFAAIIPALMVYIIIFMETHIAELIVDKPERHLKKGSGFHLDIVIISFLNAFCGTIGAPWVCVATVRSVTHVSALTVMSQTHAPGDKPYITEVKEQRLSALLVSIFVGASVLMAVLLRMVPLAVLFGIFLYMGISSMNGIQFFERLILFLMPVKHHPPVPYVKRVPTWKMHLFTVIQCGCLAVLWAVKSSSMSLAFPFFLILMIPLRAQLKRIFTSSQLTALDGKQQDIDAEDEPDFYAEATLPG